MRTAFVENLTDAAQIDSRVFLITADLGFSVLERFRDALPAQFLNAGISEQNMTGIAAALAHMGKIVFTYSIANFPTLRCFEQIRNDVCYHKAPVRIVAVGGGLVYSTQGYTHHGIEDIGVMRTLPGMIVIAPGDPIEAAAATRALCADIGPAYLRLGKAGEPVVHSGPIDFAIGRALRLREGEDVTLISTGGTLRYTVECAENLRQHHQVHARVLSMHTVKPIDRDAVISAAIETGCIVTVEEHSVSCGLGAVVGDLLASEGIGPVRFRKFGLPDVVSSRSGSHVYCREAAGNLEAVVLNSLRAVGRRISEARVAETNKMTRQKISAIIPNL